MITAKLIEVDINTWDADEGFYSVELWFDCGNPRHRVAVCVIVGSRDSLTLSEQKRVETRVSNNFYIHHSIRIDNIDWNGKIKLASTLAPRSENPCTGVKN